MDKINKRVSTLAEYIDIVKKYNLHNKYFRGENQKYSNILKLPTPIRCD